MVNKLQRPLVIGGIALASVIWLLEFLQQMVGEWGVYAVMAGAIAAGIWWIQRQSEPQPMEWAMPRSVDSSAVKQALADAEQVIERLRTEVAESNQTSETGQTQLDASASAQISAQISELETQIGQIGLEMERQTLRLIVMGDKGCGKTTLIENLQRLWVNLAHNPVQNPPLPTVTFYEAPSVEIGLEPGLTAEAIALKQAMMADLVLFLVTGDLTDSELQRIKCLLAQKRLLLVFNKQDLFLPDERQLILNRMRTWVQGSLAEQDVVAIAAAPNALKVRQHQEDGAVKEWMEERQPDIAAVAQRLQGILQEESQQLVLASALGNAIALKASAAATLNEVRRARALPVVEQFQWITAATAFASPLPSLDVVATTAINVQMILDLGNIYQHKFSLDQAQKVVTTLGSLILKLGLVEFSTRTISTLLKTNAATYIAGGCIQAISAAYLTRVAGLALIEYFHTQAPNLSLSEAKPLAVERLGQILEQVFQQNQNRSFVQTLIGQVSDRLLPKTSTPTATPTPSHPPLPLPTPPTPHSPAPPLSPPTPLAIPLTIPQPTVQVLEQVD
jgi:uncharacterized protein (DUF697 family)